MPARFLEQVLHALKKAGLVTSLRGAQGGYVLAKKPSEISLADVLEVLEGPFRPVSRFNGRLPQAAKAELLLAKVWDRVLAAERDILTSITVEELAEQQQQLEQQRSLMYHI